MTTGSIVKIAHDYYRENRTMNILVTGASGFVGQHLCDHLTRNGINTYALLRTFTNGLNVKDQFVVKDFFNYRDWKKILRGIDVVIHMAGLAHVKGHPDEDYYAINAKMTEKLALESVNAGVKRFVHTSSTHVHTSSSSINVLTPQSSCNPLTAYGKSKLLAEKMLRNIEKSGDFEVVIVRPPLVYGPSVSGNVQTLVRAIQKGIPFPFAATKNKRDMIYVENLVDALRVCAIHPAAKGNTFFVSDDRPLSIGDLIHGLAKGVERKVRLFYLPEAFMRMPLKLLKREEILEKIIGSFQLDISAVKKTLGWIPPISAEEGLEKTGRSFR
jgi:nucleoside-diphosphate-sugar epimerase